MARALYSSAAELVARGEADIAFQLLPELAGGIWRGSRWSFSSGATELYRPDWWRRYDRHGQGGRAGVD